MICDTLISFASQREKAYRFTGQLTSTRATAVSRIKTLAEYWKGKNEVCALRDSESEIRAILPNAYSRYKNQRNQILTLLNTYL
jgi:hypothetical protein